MAYDEVLAGRLRDVFFRNKAVGEKKMFGGVAFLYHGNMCVGVLQDNLIARVGPDAYDEALQREFVREFDFTGRPMRGWLVIEAEGIEDDDQLQEWVQLAVEFVKELPRK